MFLSTHPWLILAGFVLTVLIILGLIVRYVSSSQHYLDIEPRRLTEYYEKYRFYLLGMGLYVPLTEAVLHYFHIRAESQLLPNISFGIISLAIYFIADKVKFIKENLYLLFIIIFNLYSILVFDIVLKNPDNFLVTSEFTLLVMFSFLVYTRMLQFVVYNTLVMIFLFLAHVFHSLEFNTLVVYCNIINLAFALNFANYFIQRRLNKSLHLSHTIANTGPMFTIGIDKQGYIEFLSQNIYHVLGLDKQQNLKGQSIESLLGKSFLEIQQKLESQYQFTYTLTTPKGDEKIIQFQRLLIDEKILFISGIDITSNIQLKSALELQRNRLESILTNSSDLVFVFNCQLICTDIFNRNTTELLHLPEYYIGKHLADIGFSPKVYNRILHKVEEAEETNTPTNTEYMIVTNQTKKYYDLRIYTLRDSNQRTAEFIFVSRDITSVKQDEQKEKIMAESLKKQQEFLLQLSLKRIADSESEYNYFANIVERVSQLLGISRVGVWFYHDQKISCKVLIDRGVITKHDDSFLLENDYPSYFYAIKNDYVIKAENAKSHPHTYEFGDSYFEEHNIKSMMDVPIRYQGELYAIICCEQTETYKQWTDQEANFIKQVADILASEFSDYKRKQAEKELEHTRKILIQSNHIAKLGAWEFKPNTNSFVISELAYALLNLQVSDDISVDTISQKIISKQEQNLLRTSFDEAIEHGQSFDIETLMITGRGTSKWIRIIGKPEVLNGQCVCICGAFQDIDDQVKARNALDVSERHFKHITETIKDVFWLYDIEKKEVLYISPACINLFDHTPEEFYQNAELWKTYTHPDDIILVTNAHKRLFEEEYFELEYRIIIKNEIKWIYEKSFGIKDDTGRIVKNSGINVDITAQRQLSEQIRQNKALEIENQAKSLFLANISHEIRTPLNGIIGLSDLLRDTPLNAKQTEYLININESAHLLHDLINNVLDYSKINSGTVQLNSELVNLHDLCEKIKHVISFQAERKGLQFEIHLKGDIPTHLETDDIRLKQVLLNLLGNAIKFTEKGIVNLIIEPIDNESNPCIRFAIHDTGIGIKPQNIERIFDAFTQEDSSTTKRFGGTGLGLSISAKILQLMGSKIHVKSDYGHGSIFYFDLPLSVFSNPTEISISTSEANQHKLVSFFQDQITFLLVEDNKVNMFLLKAILHDLLPQCSLVEAENGAQALAYMQEHHVHLIFMDIQMPLMNGYEASAAIRALRHAKHIPILAITAGSVEGEREKALQSGMNDFLTKPIVASTIASVLKKWLPLASLNEPSNQPSSRVAIDIEKLQEANKQNSTYLKSVFPYIKESLLEGLAELKQHLVDKDHKAVSIVAHRIKGTALTGAFSRLADLTYQLEKHDFAQAERAETLLHQIEEEINLIVPLL